MIRLTSIGKSVREPNGATRHLFRDLSFDMADDTAVAIRGRSGSGKTTLLNIIAALDDDHTGSVAFAGEELPTTRSARARYRLENVGIVTQSADLLPDRNALDNVRLGVRGARDARDRAAAAMESVGIGHLARKHPRHLSGGEAQRVAIARAIVGRPRLLLADEPTGALDQQTEDDVLDLFAALRQQGTGLIVVTHSDHVAQSCARQLEIVDHALVPVVGP